MQYRTVILTYNSSAASSLDIGRAASRSAGRGPHAARFQLGSDGRQRRLSPAPDLRRNGAGFHFFASPFTGPENLSKPAIAAAVPAGQAAIAGKAGVTVESHRRKTLENRRLPDATCTENSEGDPLPVTSARTTGRRVELGR